MPHEKLTSDEYNIALNDFTKDTIEKIVLSHTPHKNTHCGKD